MAWPEVNLAVDADECHLLVNALYTGVAFALLPVLITCAHNTLKHAALFRPHIIVIGITSGLITVLGSVLAKGYSALYGNFVALRPFVSTLAWLWWWDVLPERLRLVKKGQEIICEIELKLILKFSGHQHILCGREDIPETQHQAGGKSFHGFVGVAAVYDSAEELAYLLKFYVIT